MICGGGGGGGVVADMLRLFLHFFLVSIIYIWFLYNW